MAKTKRTYQPHKSRRLRLGFRARMATVGGRRVINNRRAKKRASLSTSGEFGTKVQKNKKLSRRR